MREGGVKNREGRLQDTEAHKGRRDVDKTVQDKDEAGRDDHPKGPNADPNLAHNAKYANPHNPLAIVDATAVPTVPASKPPLRPHRLPKTDI